jgi:membrane-bound ClpP family serine protease
MSGALTWAIILLVVGLIILVIEMFVPSGGLLAVLAGGALLGSLGLAFSQGLGTGVIFLAVVVATVPSIVGAGMHYWPNTRLGRKLILQPPNADDVDPTTDRDRALRQLVGQVGRTLTPHLPSGITELAGRRVDTIDVGMGLEAGTLVRIVDVQGHRVMVRKLDTDGPDLKTTNSDVTGLGERTNESDLCS